MCNEIRAKDSNCLCLYFVYSCVRTLCDNLRRERDRAVSDLADALRNLDDMRKQKNDAAREIKEIKYVIVLSTSLMWPKRVVCRGQEPIAFCKL